MSLGPQDAAAFRREFPHGLRAVARTPRRTLRDVLTGLAARLRSHEAPARAIPIEDRDAEPMREVAPRP